MNSWVLSLYMWQWNWGFEQSLQHTVHWTQTQRTKQTVLRSNNQEHWTLIGSLRNWHRENTTNHLSKINRTKISASERHQDHKKAQLFLQELVRKASLCIAKVKVTGDLKAELLNESLLTSETLHDPTDQTVNTHTSKVMINMWPCHIFGVDVCVLPAAY